jgi:hypothetical protein
MAHLVWEDGKMKMKNDPDAALAQRYAPDSPLHPTLKVGHEGPSHDFLSIFEKSTALFFSQLAGESGSSSSCVPASNGLASSEREQNPTDEIGTGVNIIYYSISIA